MGVQGLTALVRSSKILEAVKFKNSTVVIDGPNLYYSLYLDCEPKLDQRHGGDYSAFRDQVCKFFDNLKKCKITPLVILDGGSGHEKEETIQNRLEGKLQKAKSISGSESQHSNNLLPLLVNDVFIQILQERQIEFEKCFGEADLKIALCANRRRGPVLSNDSDFYVFNLQEGFLSLNDFQWKNVQEGAIQAKLYKISKLCEHFQITPDLMPVFAAISGNDYSRLEDNGTFGRKHLEAHQQKVQRQEAILHFLGTLGEKTSEEAVRAALHHVGKPDQDVQPFLHSVQTYALNEPPVPELPAWILRAVQEGRLTSFVLSVLSEKTMMLTPLVEDFSQPSSYRAALRIRQYFYGLLVGTEPCTEYDRQGPDSMGPKPVSPVPPSPEDLPQLQLRHLDQAPEDLRRKILFEALVDSTSATENLLELLQKVPEHLKVPVCVTRFWFEYRQKNHPGDLNLLCLKALLLGFVYGESDPVPGFRKKLDPLKTKQIPLDPELAHAFSQWQCCLRDSLHLNQLLGFPLKEPQCSRLYCGPLLHRLVAELKTNRNTFTELRESLDQWRDFQETSLEIMNLGPGGAGAPGGAGLSDGAGLSGGAEGSKRKEPEWQVQRKKKKKQRK